MPKTMTIIRHAPTEYNIKGIFMGTKDIPVTDFDESIFAKIRLNEYICPSPVLYASPLLRAYATARTIANGEKMVVADNRLIERCLGSWQGMPKENVQAQYPNGFINGKMDFYFTPPGGEDYEKLVLRVASFITERCSENDNLVIVTHNGVFRVMKSLLTGQKLSDVFSEFEPYLTPQTFVITPELLDTISQNPFYTVDI